MKPTELLVTENEWEIIQKILNSHLGAQQVFVFGSRAGGKPKKFSDLDLLVKDFLAIAPDKLAILSEEFLESDLPYKVDLVLSSEISDSFKKIIEEKSILILPAP